MDPSISASSSTTTPSHAPLSAAPEADLLWVEPLPLRHPANPWDSAPPSWDAMAQQLGLPRDNGVNQATICLDGHSDAVMNRTALLWVGATGEEERWSFRDLSLASNRFANVLKDLGIGKGDRIFIFLERVPELYIALFAGLKVGAIVGPLFSAFGPEAIRDRLADSQAKLIVTSPKLKARVDDVRASLPTLEHVILVNRANEYLTLQPGEHVWHSLVEAASSQFEVAATDPQDCSIIHYTSGTTGKPKGAVQRHQAVIGQAATAKWVLDLDPMQDLYWCTADPGWVTGTSYGMFGPWALGVTQLVFEGSFQPQAWYGLLERYGVTVWYTAPTALRMLMKAGTQLPADYDLSRLRHICSVGEPLNPEAIVWGEQVFGKTILDTWWQTETGSIQITNRLGLPVKPGSMGQPFPGVEAAVLDETFEPLPMGQEGCLALRPLAPSMFAQYWGQPEKTESRFRNGWYLTGDRARVDADGYYWFIGRDDDVINTAGHLVGPFEVESALMEHSAVAEAGVIGIPDAERGEVVKAFIALRAGTTDTPELRTEIAQFVRRRLAGHAYPRQIEVVATLPKTRSGKIMRRLLKARELGLPEGDVSTLEE